MVLFKVGGVWLSIVVLLKVAVWLSLVGLSEADGVWPSDVVLLKAGGDCRLL